ncbi:MAG: hypothetical protein JSV74_00740 [Dehalococcoidia bacterium]|nr:MAG: hypothetical protein JSV74_00740 [Dehalococcoidia bacterium]
MNTPKLKIVIIIALMLSLCLIGMSACQHQQSFVPAYQTIGMPPQEADIEQLITDYLTDQATADAKYKGKKLLFSGITVEEIVNNINTYPPPLDVYIFHDLAKFTPRYLTDFDYIGEGFVVDLVGVCQGWQFSRVLIDDCWVGVVVGDVASLTTPEY